MKKNPFLFLLFCALLTAIGMAGGWYAAHQTGSDSHTAPEKEPAADDAHDHGDGNAVHLSPQAIQNMGITVAQAELTRFTRYREIPAVVRETPETYQPVFTPIGGRVQEIKVSFGAMVQAGEVIATLTREALPRPVLTLTEDILKPATEEFHQTIGQLRTTLSGLKILEQELTRLESFESDGDLPLLPRKDVITLQYDLTRARQELENLRTELLLHGLNRSEIERIEKGGEARLQLAFWHDALKRNGLWTGTAEAIYQALPDAIRDLPWAVATISELVSGNLAGTSLATWLKEDPARGLQILEIGGLLQAGSSLEEVINLHRLGGLYPRVEIRAPRSSENWDVKMLFVKPGEEVAKGDRILTLADPSRMFLRVEPRGGETSALLDAIRMERSLTARPLTPGTGPDLDDLRVLNLVNEEDSQGTVAYLATANEPYRIVEGDKGQRFRTWQLRDGLRYLVSIPIDQERMDRVFVLPSDAVTESGLDRVVFIQDGDAFKTVKVVVLYQDQDTAVLGNDSELFPGDRVVTHGAFALSLALNRGQDSPVDSHAGHNH